ncbi:hypothetical protein D9757_012396 [Collybiopsis confluens]|uniref:Alpha-type protein kinase domain-containing protein n=1 Tax=Collybiopsis confluens TaxID=2823264 RepID=A0A8H5GJ49_9AGAR|nr:hypothetical protein D9757_012396 [Collybiopsis confluens]
METVYGPMVIHLQGDGKKKCERSSCSNVVPIASMRFMANQNPENPGKHLCRECYDEKLSHPSTVMKTIPSKQASGFKQQHLSNVRARVIAAQRGDISSSEAAQQALGHYSSSFAAPALAATQTGGPIVSQALLAIQETPLPVLSSLGQPLTGYTEAHQHFERFKTHYQSLAFTTISTEQIVIQGVMYYHASEPPIHREIAPVSESMANIPVHIGAKALKLTVFHMLMPKFVKWSRGYPLEINDCELRDGAPSTKFPELHSRHPTLDRDAIADSRFFKKSGKSQVLVFNQANARKATRIALFLSEEVAHKIEAHCEQYEAMAERSRLSPLNAVVPQSMSTQEAASLIGNKRKMPPPFKFSPKKHSTQRHTISMTAPDLEINQKSSLAVPSNQSSLLLADSVHLREALQSQAAPAKNELRQLYACNLADAIATPNAAQALTHVSVMTISYSTKGVMSYGSFKRSYPSSRTDDPRLFPSGSINICIKQAFFKQPGGSGSVHVYSGVTQGKHLTVELNCLRWGTSLLKEVYTFMSSTNAGQPAFEVPELRFVNAALAIAQNDTSDTFLVEELIDDRPFVKYINNNSAKPRKLANPAQARIARFLCFAQHVQWNKTKGLAYTSDFQGSGNLLTDPQIITRPTIALEPLFGGGNTNFPKFLEEHTCEGNEFCTFWELPLPVDFAEELEPEDKSYCPPEVPSLSASESFPDPKDLLKEPLKQKQNHRMSFTHINNHA